MNYYEKFLILDPNLDNSILEETVEKIKEVIIRQGGEILKSENWGSRKLAYELNKHQKGTYIFLVFKSPPSTIAELEKYCNVVDHIIKFMVVKLTKKKQIEAILPSPSDTASTDSGDDVKSVKEDEVQTGEQLTGSEDKKNV
ncbi:MAG: 30S ribosomal protein S6 [Thermodesulfovibrionia bacterium]|nr:30S ribosomal protein S6 [Thermodesulfovibrionia bacterium]